MDTTQAIFVAMWAHLGQKDKGGDPYILHPLRVMAKFDYDLELAQIAVLHDVVEDTAVTLDSLRVHGFSERVLAGVDAMSRRKEETYNAYVDRLCQNYDACLVKLSDIADNSRLRRLPPHEWKWFASMQERYRKTEVKIAQAIGSHISKSGPGAGVDSSQPYSPV